MGKTKKQTLIKNLKVIAVVSFFVLALGYVGHNDAEYQSRPSVCREWQGSTVCYQP